MKRRQFLQIGPALGAASLAASTTIRPSSAAASGAADADAPLAQSPRPFEHDEATIAGLRQAMDAGKLTSRALTEAYLKRIDSIDRAQAGDRAGADSGPRLNSVIEVNPEALAIAEQLDRDRKNGVTRGPLHGIPILIKDNIDTADRMKTSAGSLALAAWTPAQDATVAERLRRAGAVILGKTNLSEWANFRSERSTSGWSGRGGQTRNPYALDRNPCGSSSGSGAAVAANLCAAAIGTETDGSIVCPSSINGIVGIKPTVGLVSRAGIIPISASQDTAGPMARTVADAAALLSVLTGVDPRDAATTASRTHAGVDYTRGLDTGALKGVRLGVARKSFGGSDKVDRVFAEALAALKSAGAVLIDPADLPSAGKMDEPEYEVLLYEFKDGLNTYLAAAGSRAPARTLAALIEYNEQHRDKEMPFFGQEIFLKAEKKGPLTAPAYRAARRLSRTLARAQGIDAVLTQHRVQAIVAMTTGPAWPTDLINGDRFTGGSSTPAAVAGYPSITVPMGYIHGLPVGVSFFGAAWTEATLIKLAYAFEHETKIRKPPRFLPTADLST